MVAEAKQGAATPTEVEASLAIAALDPGAVVKKLAGLRWLGGYRLAPRPLRRICDTYVDTPELELARHLVSLRLRRTNDELALTLKGDDPSAGAGIKVRRELELPWSEEALQRVWAELAGYGVRLPAEPARREGAPLARLRQRGLGVLQERSTRRLAREVVSAAEGAEPLAELVIDRVDFTFQGRTIRHREVEIELKAGQERSLVGELAAALAAKAPGALLPWSVPKLALGLWLERLLAAGALDRWLAPDGALLPEAYPALLAQARGGG